MSSDQDKHIAPVGSPPVVVVTTTTPPDYELRFDGLRTHILIRSESLIAYRNENGERQDSEKLASLAGATPFQKHAASHFAQAVVDCLNAGLSLESMQGILKNSESLSDSCPWPTLHSIGYEVAGMVVERPAVVQYIMHNESNDQVIVVTPDISERTLSASQYQREYQSRYD